MAFFILAILMGGLFIGIAFLLTTENAKYLLSGYNTMNEENRKYVDIQGYVPFFRKFHLFLGISLVVLSSGLYWVDETWAMLFVCLYPLAAYLFFVVSSAKFYTGPTKKNARWSIGIIAVVFVGTSILLLYGMEESHLVVNPDHLELTGVYGEDIPIKEIDKIELVSKIPNIKLRSNGMSMGDVNKGYYITATGETIKLILNSKNVPYILIVKKDKKRIFYSSSNKSMNLLFKNIKKTVPSEKIKS